MGHCHQSLLWSNFSASLYWCYQSIHVTLKYKPITHSYPYFLWDKEIRCVHSLTYHPYIKTPKSFYDPVIFQCHILSLKGSSTTSHCFEVFIFPPPLGSLSISPSLFSFPSIDVVFKLMHMMGNHHVNELSIILSPTSSIKYACMPC